MAKPIEPGSAFAGGARSRRPRRSPWPGRLAAMVLALAPVAAQVATAPAAANANEVVFLHWNDFHGQFRPQPATWRVRPGLPTDRAPLVGGAAALAGFVQRERNSAAPVGRRVVVTDGGDWFQGTPEGNESRGLLTVQFLSRLGLDATVLGNHEYDFGADNLRRLVDAATFPVLAANVTVAGHRPRRLCDYVRPFVRLDVHGLQLVVLGLVTGDTKAVSTGPWGDAAFEDELQALRIVMPAARAAGQVVVLLTHCGVDSDRRLAQAFPEVPLILGGHSHTGLAAPLREGDTWIVQTHGKASGVYRVEATADAAAGRLHLHRGQLVELDLARQPVDAATAAWLDEATRELTAHWDVAIAELEVAPYEERSARSTPAGNLVCDVFRSAAGADVALSNKGGIRSRLRAGPLTRRQLYELVPFDNQLVSLTLRGAQLRAVLQQSLAKGRRPLEIGGGSYRYTEREGERVLLDVTIGGVPLDESRGYRVATSSFLARGGDGLTAFAQGSELRDHQALLRDVLIQHAERQRRLRADATNRIEFVERDRTGDDRIDRDK